MSRRLLAVAVPLIYLFLPGHPFGWLRGLPLNPFGLTLLVFFGLVLFAAWPLCWNDYRAENSVGEFRAPSSAFRVSSGMGHLRRGMLRPMGLIVAVLCAGKLAVAIAAPAYGLQASYYAKPGSSDPFERSTEFPGLTATRLDQRLDFQGDSFPLYFLNDNVRFNYYRDDEPDRATLPFAARWHGWLDVPADGEYRFWLTAAGRGRLELAGAGPLEIDNAGQAGTIERSFRLSAGPRPITVEYDRRAGEEARLAVEWDNGRGRAALAGPVLSAEPARLPPGLTSPLGLVARALDVAYVLGLAMFSAWLLQARYRPIRARSSDRPALLAAAPVAAVGPPSMAARGTPLKDRSANPLLALLLAGVFAYAALTSLDLHERVVLLDGGADWLTYETYARDIQLNGPLMPLGRPIGKGRPFFFQPFYPYALAAFHWLTGEGLYGVVVLQLFGIGVAGVLVYYLADRLFGRLSGAFALLLTLGVLGPFQLDWVSRRLLSENIYFWLVPATALAFMRLGDGQCLPAARPARWDLALVAGVLLGLACVTRGPTLLWVPAVLLLTYCRLTSSAGQSDRRFSRRIAVGLVGMAALACLAAVALVPVRNWIVAGQPSLVATNGVATMELAHPLSPAVDLRGVEKNPVYRAVKLDYAIIQFVEFIRQDPLGYAATLVPLGLYALGLPGWLEPDSPIRWELVGLVALYGAYLAFSVRRAPSAALLLHSFVWLHFAMMMVFLPNVYGYRQVLPMYILLAVFGGQVLAQGIIRLRSLLSPPPHQERHREAEGRSVEQYVPGARPTPRHEELA